MRDSVKVHKQLMSAWPALARRYREQMDDMVSQDSWRKTLQVADPAGEDRSDETK